MQSASVAAIPSIRADTTRCADARSPCRSRLIYMRRKYILLVALLLGGCLVLSGCLGGSLPPKGWSKPVVANLSVEDEFKDFIYVGAMQGRVAAFELFNGNAMPSWRYPAESQMSYIYGDPLVVDDKVYIAAYSGRL